MNKHKIESIQALRALASLMVVVFHAQRMMQDFAERGARDAVLNLNGAVAQYGSLGVDIFFIISGIVMTIVSARYFETTNGVRTFLIKRFVRIFPVYWFYLSLMVLIFSLFHGYMRSNPIVNYEKAISSAFLIPYADGGSDASSHYTLGAAWTLTYEWYFYILVSVSLLLPKRFFVPFIAVIFLFGNAILGAFASVHPLFGMLGDSIVYEFVFGIVIAQFLMSKSRISMCFATFCAVSGPVLMFLGLSAELSIPRIVRIGMPCAAFVFGIIALDKAGKLRIPRLMSQLGDSSYSLYLSHGLVMSCVGKLLTTSGVLPLVSSDILIVLITVVCLIFGHVAYVMVENPLVTCFSQGPTPRFGTQKDSSYECARD